MKILKTIIIIFSTYKINSLIYKLMTYKKYITLKMTKKVVIVIVVYRKSLKIIFKN